METPKKKKSIIFRAIKGCTIFFLGSFILLVILLILFGEETKPDTSLSKENPNATQTALAPVTESTPASKSPDSTDESSHKSWSINPQELPDFKIFKINTLPKERLAIEVEISGRPTEESLITLSKFLIKKHFGQSWYAYYVQFRAKELPKSGYVFGYVEYGPNGSAGFSDSNKSKPLRLNVSSIKIPSDEMLQEMLKSEQETALTEPKKSELKKTVSEIFQNEKDFSVENFVISTYEEGFSISFDVSYPNGIKKDLGKIAISKVREAKLPYPVLEYTVVVLDQSGMALVRYNEASKKFYVTKDGKTEEF